MTRLQLIGGLLALCAASLLALGGCGESSVSSSGSLGVQHLNSPKYAELAAFKRRCKAISNRGAIAHVTYRRAQSMTRGTTATVTASVALGIAVPPSETLAEPNEVVVPAIVSCVIEAQLEGSSDDFSISNRDWRARSFLSSDTAEWIWYVGPKIGGDKSLTLNLRPIVTISAGGASSVAVDPEGSDVRSLPIRVHVKVPWSERLPEAMSQLAATFKVAQGMVTAITGLLVAGAAFGAALGIKGARNRRRSQDGSATPPPA